MFDLLLTDPPYCVSQKGISHVGPPGKGTRKLDFFVGDDDWVSMLQVWRSALSESVKHLLPHASIYAWVGHRQFGPTVDDLESLGFSTRFMVWVKQCPAPPPPGAGWPSGAELCVYGWKPGRRWMHNGTTPPPNNVFASDSFRHGQPGKVDHPTQKPIQIIRPLIAASTQIGDTVVDPFCGSGSTLVAAKLRGIKAVGIELEERYVKIAIERLRQGVLIPC